jgi:hypothetical protein
VSNRFRFIQGMSDRLFRVMEDATGLRYPGTVTVDQEDGSRTYVWRREVPGGDRHVQVTIIKAPTVAALSAALAEFFDEVNDG